MSQVNASEISRLRRQLTALSRRLRREARNDPESWTRMLLISAIDRCGDTATPSLLASSEAMRSAHVAAVLRDLESAGLIVRSTDSEDRRKTRLRLTEGGLEALESSRQQRDLWLNAALVQCLTREEQQLLIAAGSLLEKLANC